MPKREIAVVEENGRGAGAGTPEGRDEERVGRLVALGRALSDPIRVRMLGMMADGRGCCDFSGAGSPADEGDEGICVCEFQDAFGMGQSKVSYHIKKLTEAGLVGEEKRGRWSFYSLDREAAEGLLAEAEGYLTNLVVKCGLCRFLGESGPKRTGTSGSRAGCSTVATRCHRLTAF